MSAEHSVQHGCIRFRLHPCWPSTLRWAPWLLCALWMGACAHTRTGGPRVRILPQTPGAANYDATPPPGPGTEGDLQTLADDAFNTFPGNGAGASNGPLSPDPRLAELSRFAAEHYQLHGSLPAHAGLDFMAHHLGLPEPSPHLTLIRASRGELTHAIVERLTNREAGDGYTHVGCSANSEDLLGGIAVIALSSRPLTMEPIARTLPPGQPVAFRGTLDAPFHNATVVVAAPDGSSDRRSAGKQRKFEYLFSPPIAGTYRVELLAEGPHGLTVVANFPLYVGVPPATEVVVELPQAGAHMDPAAVASELLQRANQERERAKLSPLRLDDALSAVAAAHNRDMHEHGFVGHSSPTTGTALDRVDAAGIRTGLVLENIGQAYSAEELHRGWMESPGHRRNILDGGATHMGVAVQVMPSMAGPPQILATILFIRRVPPLASNAMQQLADGINTRRKAHGLSPLPLDPRLIAACQTAAERHFKRPQLSMEDNIQRLHVEQQRNPGDYRMLNATMRITHTLETVADESALLDPAARGLGIGLSQGQRPGDVPGSIAVVLALGY